MSVSKQKTEIGERKKELSGSAVLQVPDPLQGQPGMLQAFEQQAAVLSPESPRDREATHIRLSKIRTSAPLPCFT